MKLENYEVHLPSYSIGDKIYDKIGPARESYGKTVLVIGGEKALDAAYDKLCSYVKKTNLHIIGKEIFGKALYSAFIYGTFQLANIAVFVQHAKSFRKPGDAV